MSYSNRFSFFLKIKSIAQNQSSLSTKKIIGGFFVGVAVLILCIPILNKKFQIFENFFDEKLSSLHSTTATFNFNAKKFRENFFSVFSFISENTKLKHENEKLRAIAAQLSHIKLENKNLKLINKFIFPKTKRILSTRLIFRSDGQVGMAKILVGRKDGIKNGQFVVTHTGALIGKIINVSDKVAKILLISGPKSKISVTFPRIKNKAILSGNFKENLHIIFTKSDKAPVHGDIVITSGDDSYFPPGLIVGTVVTYKTGQKIVIPMADPRNIEFVSVLKFEGENN